MGKVVTFLTILIFIDLLFIATGQVCSSEAGCSLGSIIFNAILNLADFNASTFFGELIGNIGDLFNSGTGIFALVVGSAVTVGARSQTIKADTTRFTSDFRAASSNCTSN